jgi:hypothetical protein
LPLHSLTPSQLTEDEIALFHYVTDLTNWLDPLNNFVRPRPEANKPSPKNSHSSNDEDSSNGHGRKPDDPPQITEPTESILSYFKSEQLRHLLYPLPTDALADVQSRFTRAVEANRPIYEILHTATLAQEAS